MFQSKSITPESPYVKTFKLMFKQNIKPNKIIHLTTSRVHEGLGIRNKPNKKNNQKLLLLFQEDKCEKLIKGFSLPFEIPERFKEQSKKDDK